MVAAMDGLYLYGGEHTSDHQASNRLWPWDGANWVDLTPSPLPASWPDANRYPDMAYDRARNRLVLILLDVWEYDLEKGLWENRTAGHRPEDWPAQRQRQNTALYDPQSDRTMLVDIRTTWFWDGKSGTWTRIETPQISAYNKSDAYQVLGYDALRSKIVLYTNYYNAAMKWYVITWEWSGKDWVKVADCIHDYTPSGSMAERMVSLPAGVMLVDGYYHYKDPKAEFWLWDGIGWMKIFPNAGAPPNTKYPEIPMAYDDRANELVMLTNTGETWVYRFNPAPRMDAPVPYLFTGKHESTGKSYGPGMKLSWTPTTNPNAAYYEIQYSEDAGNAWLVYNSRRPIAHGGWINQHGNLDCGHGFSYCLKRYFVYNYRVWVLDGAGKPLTDWSNVVSARSFEWPTDIELSDPMPSGPYMDDETVTLTLETAIGPYLYIDWVIVDHEPGRHAVERGCQDGYYWQNPETRYCTITVLRASSRSWGIETFKLAAPALARRASVEVWAKASGIYPTGQVYTDSDYRVLLFKPKPTIEPEE